MTCVTKARGADRSLGHLPDVERLKRPLVFATCELKVGAGAQS